MVHVHITAWHSLFVYLVSQYIHLLSLYHLDLFFRKLFMEACSCFFFDMRFEIIISVELSLRVLGKYLKFLVSALFINN